jgi:hypothetical protein
MNNLNIEKKLKETGQKIKPKRSLLNETLNQLDLPINNRFNYLIMLKNIFKKKNLKFSLPVMAVLILFIVYQFNSFKGINSHDQLVNSEVMENKEKESLDANFSDEVAKSEEEVDVSQSLDDNYLQKNSIAEQIENKIIKNGNLRLKVENIDESFNQTKEIVKKNKGEIFATNFQGTDNKRAQVTIKVPVNKFETLMKELKNPATEVISESSNAQDVSEEFFDLQTRIKSKKAEEQAFINLLDKADKIEDILKITKEQKRVRSEIESLEGRLNYLTNKTTYSTINLSLSQDVKLSSIDENWRIDQTFKKATQMLIDNLKGFVTFLIFLVLVIVPTLLPYFIIVLILFWIIKKLINFFRKK